MSDPRVNFSLIVHINILKKPPQISAHKSHVKNEFQAILDIFLNIDVENPMLKRVKHFAGLIYQDDIMN